MKFDNLSLGETYKIKIVAFKENAKDYLHRAFEVGKTYTMTTSRYDHDSDWNWTTYFICYECEHQGFTQISEIEAVLEIVE